MKQTRETETFQNKGAHTDFLVRKTQPQFYFIKYSCLSVMNMLDWPCDGSIIKSIKSNQWILNKTTCLITVHTVECFVMFNVFAP